MADTNGKLGLVREFRARLEEDKRRARESVLAEWKDTHPHLRALLLGEDMKGALNLTTSLSFQVGPYAVQSRVTRPDLGLVASTEHKSFVTLLDMWENFLDTGTMPWREDYHTEKRLRQELRREL